MTATAVAFSSQISPVPLEPVEVATVRLAIASESATITMVTTMATWCGACQKELPQFELLRRRFEADEVAMHAIPVDPQDTKEKLDAYVAAHRPDYELIRGAAPPQITLVRRIVFSEIGIDGLPATVVTDSSGRVLHVQAGVPTVSKVRQVLADLAVER